MTDNSNLWIFLFVVTVVAFGIYFVTRNYNCKCVKKILTTRENFNPVKGSSCGTNAQGVTYCTIGSAPFCNPVADECPSGTVWLGSRKYSSFVPVGAVGEGCSTLGVGNGYRATCTNAIYPTLNSWMADSVNMTDGVDPRTMGNKPLNQIFLPGSHDTMTYGINQSGVSIFDNLRLGSDAPIASLVKYTSIPGVQNIVGSIIQNWAKAQAVDVLAQLNNGMRYLDLRLCLDTNNGKKVPTFNDLKFTHSLISDVTFAQMIDQVVTFHRANPNEIIILDFHYILNFSTTNTTLQFFVDPKVQMSIQLQALTYIQNAFGSSLSMASDSLTNTYNYFIDKGTPILILFDDEGAGGECGSRAGGCNSIVPVTGNNLPFPAYWVQNGYPWVRNRLSTISKTFANAYTGDSNPRDSFLESTCQLPGVIGANCYSTYPDTDKFVVYGATVGMVTDDNAAQIRCGNLCPVACPDHPSCVGSQINYPSGLLNAATNYAPPLINNLLDRWGYMWKGGYFTTPTPTPPGIGTHNIFIYDNVTAYNVSSIIVAVAQQTLGIYTGNPYNPAKQTPIADKPFYMKDATYGQYLQLSQHHMNCHGDQIWMVTPTGSKAGANLFRFTNVNGWTTNLQILFNNVWYDLFIEDCNPTWHYEFQYLTFGSGCSPVTFTWSSVPNGYTASITGSCHHDGALCRQEDVQGVTCYGNGYNSKGYKTATMSFEYQ